MLSIDLDSIREQIQDHLKDYLAEHNVEIKNNGSQKFRCINPDHNDSNPSAVIIPNSNGREWKCFGCLDKNELVWSQEGLTKIKDLNINDYVYTLDGSLQKISNKLIHQKPIWEMHLHNVRHNPLLLTPDHLCLVIHEKDLIDGVPFIRYDIRNKSQNKVLKFYSRLKNRKLCYKYQKPLRITIEELQNINPGDYVLYPVITNKQNTLQSTKQNHHHNQKWVINSLPVNSDCAWLYGIYLAEGSLHKRHISFTFHINEQSTLAAKTLSILQKEFGIKGTIKLYPDKNTCVVFASSVDLVELFDKEFGHICDQKRIPVETLHWDINIQKSLIGGWLDGDKGSTTSKNVANSMYNLFIQCGMVPSLSYKEEYFGKKDGIKRKPSWLLYEVRESVNGFFYTINNQKYFIAKISEITKTNKIDEVIDITVDNNHTFLTRIGIVHNCGKSGDIFTAAHYLENKPIGSDSDFYTENVLYLAEKYDIPVPVSGEISEEQVLAMKARRAYQLALRLMIEQTPDALFDAAVTAREWDKERIKQYGIWQVSDFNKFKSDLLSHNFDIEFLEEIGLIGSAADWMFGPERMVFTQFDHKKRPIGFVSRNLTYETDITNNIDSVKYKNTKTTKLFEKSKYLYGLDLAAQHPDRVLFIVEGQADVITYRLKTGQVNIVALGGTSFTDFHLAQLLDLGFNSLCICLDGDAAGRSKTGDIVEKTGGRPGLSVSVITLPSDKDQKDIDAFLRKHGVDGWNEAKSQALSAFQWRFSNRNPDEPKELFITSQIHNIVNEPNPLRRWEMTHELAKATDVPEDVIKEAINHVIDASGVEYKNKLLALVQRTTDRLSRTPTEAPTIISLFQTEHDVLEREYKKDVLTPQTQVDLLRSHRQQELATTSENGLKLGFPIFDQKTTGINAEDTIIFLGGKSNVGKTSWISQLTHNVLKYNEDSIVICYTIDDSAPKFYPRMVANMTGIPTSWVHKPYAMLPDLKDIPKDLLPFGFDSREQIVEKTNEIYRKLEGLMAEGRLFIVDANLSSATWAYADAKVRQIRKDNPKSKIVLFLDNFHDLRDFPGGDTRDKFSELSKLIRKTTSRDRITVFSTIEYTKMNDRVKPSNSNLAESRKMEYIADGVIHLVNHLHEFRATPNDCKVFWSDPREHELLIDDKGFKQKINVRKPVVELMFGKSKISSFKGSIFYKFDPERCQFIEGTDQEQKQWLRLDNDQQWFSNR